MVRLSEQMLSGGNAMSTIDTFTQAGWYAVGGGRERYWDGQGWTEQVRPVPAYVGVEQRDGLLHRLTDFLSPVEYTAN